VGERDDYVVTAEECRMSFSAAAGERGVAALRTEARTSVSGLGW
jgi:hypothetical protein